VRIKNLASLSRFTCLLPIIFIGVSSTVFATQNGQVASQTPSSPASVAPSAAPAITSSSNKAIPQATPLTTGKTNWVDLSAEQKAALSPLAKEWDKMDDLRKKKWLGIANKYANMKPEEQHRVQERVQAWVNMTPEQRMAVRENFSNTAKKTPEQKSAQWLQYQQLSDAEKAKLANEAKTKKIITTIQPESKRTGQILTPIKKGPPPVAPASNPASQAGIK
jgi:hypothetical protein